MTARGASESIGLVLTDEQILTALKRGDERAFCELVERHQSLMLRVARRYVRSPAVAEEVVQETWLGVLRGLDRFEGRAVAEDVDLPHPHQPGADARRARGPRRYRSRRSATTTTSRPSTRTASAPRATSGRAAGRRFPPSWDALPEERLLARETLALVGEAIAGLPERQHLVILMRDIEGWDADEVCQALAISEANQRVLLHRARSKVRRSLEAYLEPELMTA